MDLSQIIKQVNRDVDDAYSNADITDWVNRCLDELTPLAKKEASTVLTITSTNSYDLPADLFQVAMVLVNNDQYDYVPFQDRNTKGYRLWANQLFIQPNLDISEALTGEIELYYYKKFTHLVNPEEIPELEEPFHDLLVLYASAMSQYMDSLPEKQTDALNRYYARKQEYADYIERKHGNTFMISEVDF